MFTMIHPVRVPLVVFLSLIMHWSVRADENLIRRIRNFTTVTSSQPIWSNWAAERAIDFKDSSEANTCHCCSASTKGPSWWRIDLGARYPIEKIIFIGRSDGATYQSRKFSMYKYDDFNGMHPKHELIYKNNATKGHKFMIPFSQQLILQFIEINSTTVLTICEIKFKESERCPPGYYGKHCMEHCNCLDSQPCERSTGLCQQQGCLPGWQGGSCDKSCDWGFYGDGCARNCHCLNNASCESVSGNCSNGACSPGWEGLPTCSQECDWGKFGNGCAQHCHCYQNASCHNVNGTCLNGMCAAGWKTHSCSKACQQGTFGFNCLSKCHCANEMGCNRFTGSCADNVCEPGWQGNNCSIECDHGYFGQNCTHLCHCRDHGKCRANNGTCESGLCSAGWRHANCSNVCLPGTFGLGCKSFCHCANGTECNHINGSCADSLCEPGWQGSSCSIAVQSATNEPQKASTTGAVIGAVAGVIAVVCLIVVVVLWQRRAVVVFWQRRKRSARQKDAREPNATPTGGGCQVDHTEPTMLCEERKKTKFNSSINENTARADENLYYNYDKEQKISAYLLWDYLTEAYADKCEKLYQEFQQLPHGLTHECTEARKQENARKNRYKDMYAYDHSRVILRRVDETLSTYINACYVDGYTRKKKFIACQGPMKGMVEDFWQMIFQENASLIVMLTNVLENGARKCIQYWPPTEDDELTFGDVTVKTKRASTLPDYVIRELDVRKAGYASRCITHAHFTAWPDKDVPDTPWHLVHFWRKLESTNGDEPIVIHCSAGVGRTGTYIALDILLAQAKAEGYIQPYSVVENMRHQRVNMVQTKAQYVFLHEAVAEALYTNPSPIKVNEYASVFESLLEIGTLGVKTGLEQQFQLVQDKMENTSTVEYCNFSSARESDAFYANRPQESSLLTETSPPICYLQNYLKTDTFILAQLSDAIDSNRLLKLIDEKNIRTVISLTDLDNKDEHSLFDRKSRSRVKIEHVETRREKLYDEKVFSLKGQKSAKEEQRVKQFVYRADATTSAVSIGTENAIQLLNAVLKWQTSFEDDKSVLITYGSSLGSAGILCLLLVEFERIRDREEVNLLETVKHMKQRNPMLLSDYEHYKFCHEAVLEYIRQSDVYINV